MGWGAVLAVRELDPGRAVIKEGSVVRYVRGSERKLVLLVLAISASEARPWRCFPSERVLAEWCEMSERHLQRVLASLVADGLVERYRAEGRGLMTTILFPNGVPNVSTGCPDP